MLVYQQLQSTGQTRLARGCNHRCAHYVTNRQLWQRFACGVPEQHIAFAEYSDNTRRLCITSGLGMPPGARVLLCDESYRPQPAVHGLPGVAFPSGRPWRASEGVAYGRRTVSEGSETAHGGPRHNART